MPAAPPGLTRPQDPRSMFHTHDLGKKLSALIGLVVLLGASAIALMVTLMGGSAVREQAFERARADATATSIEVQRALEGGLNAARNLSSSFQGLKARGFTDRIQYAVMLQKVLEDNADMVGVWTRWEADAFDGKDKRFSGAPGADAEGRFMPYWAREGGEIALLSVQEVADSSNGEYYDAVKRNGHEIILPPAFRTIGGKEVLVTRLVAPVTSEGRTVGVAGVDLALNGVQTLVAGLRPFGTGRVALVSSDGRYVASAKPEDINKPLDAGGQTASLLAALRDAKLSTLERESGGLDVFTAVVPLVVGRTGTPWGVIVDVPLETVTAAVPRLRNVVIAISFLSCLFIVVIAYFLFRRFVTRPLARVEAMVDELGKGHLGHRTALTQSDEVGRTARALDRLAAELQQHIVGAMKRIAVGDLAVETTVKDERDEITPALEMMVAAVRGLVNEAAGLSRSAVAGELATRGNPDRFQGAYRQVIEGVNATLDAVIGPLNVAAEYVDRISKGDLPPKITDVYKGDFNEIRNNLNVCIDAVQALVADAAALTTAAIEGRLRARADASRHQGDFRVVVNGMNATMDSLVGHLDSMPTPALIIDREFTILYMNDLGAKLGGSTPQDVQGRKCYDHFRAGDCHSERCACGRAIAEGRTCSAETDAHPGSLDLEIAYSGVPLRDAHGKVIGAFEVVSDQTAVRQAASRARKVADYQERETGTIAEALGKLAQGQLDFTLTVTPGDAETAEVQKTFERLGTAVAESASAVRRLVADASHLAQAAVEGRLATRADASAHHGDFRKIVEGVNATLDAVVGPL
ncbi:MAG: HAMP domain-containing protein, partial [Acidobacteria bacterium]